MKITEVRIEDQGHGHITVVEGDRGTFYKFSHVEPLTREDVLDLYNKSVYVVNNTMMVGSKVLGDISKHFDMNLIIFRSPLEVPEP